MKRRDLLAIFGGVLLVISASVVQAASPPDFLHYRDAPPPPTINPAVAEHEVKTLGDIWPTIKPTPKRKVALDTSHPGGPRPSDGVRQRVPAAQPPTAVAAQPAPAMPAAAAVQPAKSDPASDVPSNRHDVPTRAMATGLPERAAQQATAPAQRDVEDLPPCVRNGHIMGSVYRANQYACIPVMRSRVWFAHAGDTIQTTLDKWAKKAGWTVVWRSRRDLDIPASFSHTGQFEAATTWMFRQLASEGVLFKVRFFEGNQTVVVSLVS